MLKKLKYWLYWLKRPNLAYILDTQEEISNIRYYLRTEKAQQELGEKYDEILKDFTKLYGGI